MFGIYMYIYYLYCIYTLLIEYVYIFAHQKASLVNYLTVGSLDWRMQASRRHRVWHLTALPLIIHKLMAGSEQTETALPNETPSFQLPPKNDSYARIGHSLSQKPRDINAAKNPLSGLKSFLDTCLLFSKWRSKIALKFYLIRYT